MIDPILANLYRRGESIVAIADANGWPRPAEYVTAQAWLRAVRMLDTQPPAAPTRPDNTDDAAEYVDALVEHELRAAARRGVIDRQLEDAQREVARMAITVVLPYVVEKLVPHFDALVAAYAKLSDAPRVLTGHEATKAMSAHAELLRIAGQLTVALQQRLLIADAAGEQDVIGGRCVWLIFAPNPSTSRDAAEEALRRFDGAVPSTIDDWDTLLPIGLGMATPGEVEQRQQRHAQVLHQIAMSTPDRGVHDHTYDEANARSIGGLPDGGQWHEMGGEYV